jgi:hypothetical protein
MQLTPIADLKVVQLKAICKRLKLSTSGVKADLQATLRAHARQMNYRRSEDLKDFVVNTDNIDSDDDEPEIVASTAAPATLPASLALPSVTSPAPIPTSAFAFPSPAPIPTSSFAFPAVSTTASSSAKPDAQMTTRSRLQDLQRDQHSRTESVATLCGGTSIINTANIQGGLYSTVSTAAQSGSWIPHSARPSNSWSKGTQNGTAPTSAPFSTTKTSPPVTPPTSYAFNSAGVNKRSRDSLRKESSDIRLVTSRSPEDIEALLDSLENLAAIYEWTGAETMTVLRTKLSPSIQREACIEPTMSFETASRQLRKRLGYSHQKLTTKIEMLQRNRSESAGQAFSRLINLLSASGSIYPSLPAEAKQQLLRTSLRKILRPREYENFYLSWIGNQQTTDLAAIAEIISLLEGNWSSPEARIIGDVDADEYDLNVASRGTNCHLCGEAGHYMRECTLLTGIRQMGTLATRMDQMEAMALRQDECLNRLLTSIEQIAKTSQAACNSTMQPQQHVPTVQSEGQRRGNRGPKKPFCRVCPLTSDGHPPRHYWQECPQSRSSQ